MFDTTRQIREFIQDERGEVAASMYILIVSIVSVGMLCGLTTLRDTVVQQFGDMALAIDNLDQSFSITYKAADGTTTLYETINVDTDANGGPDDPVGGAPAGIVLNQTPTGE